MKYLLSFTLVLFISFSSSAQRPVEFKVDLQTSLYDQINLPGISLGLVHKSNWLVQYDFTSNSQKPFNLPKRYEGHDLHESYSIHSLSIGRAFSLNDSKSLKLLTKCGFHSGRYNGYENFVSLPPQNDLTVVDALGSGLGAIILLPIALTDHLNYQSHSYEPIKENLNGFNGEIILEYEFNNYLVISTGGKWISNKRIKDFGPTFNIGVQF